MRISNYTRVYVHTLKKQTLVTLLYRYPTIVIENSLMQDTAPRERKPSSLVLQGGAPGREL
jgi:hypothetical protein